MAIFAVIPKDAISRAQIESKLRERYATSDVIEVGSGQWLLSATGTPTEVSNNLGITEPPNVSALVLSVTGYWGRAPTTVWDWLKARIEASQSG